jgi:hypothetical protein
VLPFLASGLRLFNSFSKFEH